MPISNPPGQPQPDTVNHYEQIQVIGNQLVNLITLFCPDSREKTLAIVSAQRAMQWALTSLTINPSV